MNPTARNVIQNTLGISRIRADWLAEKLTDAEAASLSQPTLMMSSADVRTIAADCVVRIETEIRPAG